MEKLMATGWRFELFQNELDSYTAIAKKGSIEIVTDEFSWWPLITAIVAKVEKYEQRSRK